MDTITNNGHLAKITYISLDGIETNLGRSQLRTVQRRWDQLPQAILSY